MGELNVRLVAMDHPLWDGVAKMVVVTTPEGEMGILPGHEPVLALLTDGEVRIRTIDDQTILAVVHGGFFSVANDEVSILGETAELDTDIDVERAKRALDRIMADGKIDRAEKDAEIRARTRLKVAVAAEARGMHTR